MWKLCVAIQRKKINNVKNKTTHKNHFACFLQFCYSFRIHKTERMTKPLKNKPKIVIFCDVLWCYWYCL